MSKNKKVFYKLLSLCMTLGNEYKEYDEVITDEKVNDCLLDFYFTIMCNEKTESDKFYNSFERKYKKLNDEQQEIAKVEIARILDVEYKPKTKIKKKER